METSGSGRVVEAIDLMRDWTCWASHRQSGVGERDEVARMGAGVDNSGSCLGWVRAVLEKGLVSGGLVLATTREK